MSLILDLLCTARSFVIGLSYNYLFLHDLCPMVSDIDFMISLLCYYMCCLVRDLVLVNFYILQYSYVCSSMMSVHPKGGGSASDTRVSLVKAEVVSGLIMCSWMSPFSTFVEVAGRW